MKRLPVITLLLFAMLTAAAEEKLRIIDATDSGGSAVVQLALGIGRKRNCEVSLHTLDAATALEKLAANETDVVLLNRNDLPQPAPKNSFRYATGAFLAVVSAKNPVRRFSSADLKLLFGVPSPKWELVGGDSVPVTRIAVRSRRGAFFGAERLGIKSAAGTLLLATVDEAILVAESDPNALVWGPFMADIPVAAVAAEVDGVAPTRAAIRSGRYVFSIPRYAVGGDKIGEAAREFLQMLRSGEFAELLEEDGELPELPEVPTAQPGGR